MHLIFEITSHTEKTLRLTTSCHANQELAFTANLSVEGRKLVIPDGVNIESEEYLITEIGPNVFELYKQVEEIYIPQTVTNIIWSFYECRLLLQIHVDEGNPNYKDIDGVLFSKNGKKLIAFPNGRTEYDIPDGVERIESFAFKTSDIYKLTIPNSVEEIGNDVFYQCPHLKYVILPDSVKSIGEVQYYTSAVFVYKGKDYSAKEIASIIK